MHTRRLAAFAALATAAAAPTNQTVYNTFYGAKDNCPPGGSIAHPVLHPLAGGTGTFADPITFAGAVAAVPYGTIVYSWRLQKYFIMEDDCEECAADWKAGKWHFDVRLRAARVSVLVSRKGVRRLTPPPRRPGSAPTPSRPART